MICAGKQLENGQTLVEARIERHSCLVMAVRTWGGIRYEVLCIEKTAATCGTENWTPEDTQEQIEAAARVCRNMDNLDLEEGDPEINRIKVAGFVIQMITEMLDMSAEAFESTNKWIEERTKVHVEWESSMT